jgi:hypothetical protein
MYSIREYLFRLGVTDIRLSEKPETCDTFELVWRTCNSKSKSGKIGVSSSKEPKINGAIIAFHAQLELVTEISFDIKASLHLSKKVKSPLIIEFRFNLLSKFERKEANRSCTNRPRRLP